MQPKHKLKIAAGGDRDLVMTRVFDAPRALVFAASTQPALLQRWLLGPAGWTMPVCEVDLRVGGTYRYVWRKADGRELGMGGVFRQVAPPARIVATEKFDHAWSPGEAVSTLVLTERDGQTTLTNIIRYESRAARDAVLASGMAKGVGASYDRLEEIVIGKPRRAAKPPARKSAAKSPATAGPTDPAVTKFLRELKHPLKREFEAVRKILLEASPEIREGLKWNAPSFRTTDYFATLHLRSRDRVQLIFHTGAKVKATAKSGISVADPAGLMKWLAKDRGLVTLGAGPDIAAQRPAFEQLVRAWLPFL